MEITEQKFEEILKGQREEYQNYLSVVAEDFSSKLRLLVESLSGVQKQLEVLRDMVARNTEDITELRAMMARNTKDIAVIKTDIQFIKQDLRHKVEREEFELLEKRVLALEDKV